jgi:DeoR family fructose operon transcriptional repressor
MGSGETNTQDEARRETLLAVERRRRVLAWVQRHGAANVAQLAQTLDVGPNTIRRDLAMLAKEGKLIRSHGGAVANDPAFTRMPYVQVRHEHGEQKERIATVALEFLPETGSVFLSDGTSVQAFAMQIPPSASIHVVTNSVQIAARLTAETAATVELLGGRVRPELLATDCSLATEALNMLFWDIAFIGAAALDVSYGITERDAPEAARQRKFIDRATRVIALCDSSKLGRCSYARVGPLSLVDTIVTDMGADPDVVRAIRDTGVEIILAGENVLQREVGRSSE